MDPNRNYRIILDNVVDEARKANNVIIHILNKI